MSIFDRIKQSADGDWHNILAGMGIDVPQPKKHGPCPKCGGNDRFHFDDKQGRGTWFCRGCDMAGDGISLVANVNGMSKIDAAKQLAGYLGVEDDGYDREQVEANRMKAKENREKQAKQEKLEADQGAERAASLWATCKPATPNQPYIQRKQIQAHGARVLTADYKNGGTQFSAGDLVVPVADFDDQGKMRIRSLELIGAKKQGMYGTKRSGCFYPLGGSKALEGAKQVFIAEGFATASSVSIATGKPAVCCFSAGQIKTVADKIAKSTGTEVIIAADHDEAGIKAAEKSGYRFAVPPQQGTDWNDFAVAGWDVSKAIREQLNPIQPDDSAQFPDSPENHEPTTIQSMAELGFINWVHPKSNGKPKPTLENFLALMDALNFTARYNLISKETEINLPGMAFTTDNAANAQLAVLESYAAKFDYPTDPVKKYVLAAADRNPYNPVKNWIESKPWDGQDRINELTSTLDAECHDTALFLVTRWLISAVAAAFNPNGVSSGGVLVLQGKQGLGKTSWFWKLLNGNREWGKESAILNPSDRDSVKQCISYWLVELGELDATFRKSDIAALKGFITRDHDEFRRAYAPCESKYPRRTVFFASVNPKGYLHDDTGNRRFWTIPCGDKMDFNHNIDIQQVWAQVLTYYQAGESWHLTREEANRLEDVNEDFHGADPIEELIARNYDFNTPRTERMTATDVLISIGYDKPNKIQTREAGVALRRLLGVDGPKKSGSVKFYSMPSKKIGT